MPRWPLSVRCPAQRPWSSSTTIPAARPPPTIWQRPCGMHCDGDPHSAFGSVLGFNRPLDAATAEVLAEPGRFIEAIVAPDFEPAALEILTTRPKWKANVRLMEVGPLAAPKRRAGNCAAIEGGMLVQEADIAADPENRVAGSSPPPSPTTASWRRSALRLGDRAAREVERDRAGEATERWSASARGR